jgi:hypothetical protein
VLRDVDGSKTSVSKPSLGDSPGPSSLPWSPPGLYSGVSMSSGEIPEGAMEILLACISPGREGEAVHRRDLRGDQPEALFVSCLDDITV